MKCISFSCYDDQIERLRCKFLWGAELIPAAVPSQGQWLDVLFHVGTVEKDSVLKDKNEGGILHLFSKTTECTDTGAGKHLVNNAVLSMLFAEGIQITTGMMYVNVIASGVSGNLNVYIS